MSSNQQLKESCNLIQSKYSRLRRVLPFIFYLLSFILLHPQSFQELQKLQSEYKKVLEKQALQKPADISDAEKTAQSTALPDKLIYSRKDVESLLANTEKLLEQLKYLKDSTKTMPYIGYDIFTKRDTIPFWQNIPIPKEYILGPGDEVIISLWGETESYNTKVINRDGQVFIENIGLLQLGGKTLTKANSYVLSKYSKVYSTLISKTPKSFIDITLGELKSVNVHFVGFVNIPGVHMIHPFSNVFTGLIQAGGVDIMGSLRDIQVFRSGKSIGSVDLYNYLFAGNINNDIRLQDQDIIFIPPRQSTIALTGRTKKPGYYELKQKESVEYLFQLSGGTDAKSAHTYFVYRNNGLTPKSSAGFLLDESELKTFSAIDGDSIHIPHYPDIPIFVKIDGQIKNPGTYPFEMGMNLYDLLKATMVMEDGEYFQTLDRTSIKVFRKNPNNINPISILVNITDLDDAKAFQLQNNDHITIPNLKLFQPIESIHITGEINSPGIYPVNNMTTLSMVLREAGGLTENALNQGIQIFRDSLQIAWKKQDFNLQDGDSLHVMKEMKVIKIMGEVNQPGYVAFQKGVSLKSYIKRAGGYSAFADPRDVVVIHPNGTAIPKSKWSTPKVMDGSTIIVYPRALTGSSRGPSGWEAFTMVSTQTANIATTLLTLMLLANQSSGQ
ncbi:MAG: SLBB domain-containing protein [Candidatus Marinimicrobia bacterium]|nr:SLBB domain-containing protein [Candidatus Neomarinimicrobiota bacterium]